jgi:hypothetical protein
MEELPPMIDGRKGVGCCSIKLKGNVVWIISGCIEELKEVQGMQLNDGT